MLCILGYISNFSQAQIRVEYPLSFMLRPVRTGAGQQVYYMHHSGLSFVIKSMSVFWMHIFSGQNAPDQDYT